MGNIINCMKVSDLNFSEVENAVHLDLSEGEYPFLDDGKSFNKGYFARIHNNAIQILQDLFQKSNTIDIVLVYYLYGDSFKKTRFKEKFSYFNNNEIPDFKKYINDEGIQCYALSYKNKKLKDLNYKKLVRAICNQDFKSLFPTINQKDNYLDIYLMDNKRGILYESSTLSWTNSMRIDIVKLRK
ncbi:DUF3885 domain-containing protein [Staphylococcus felis]|uniref:DUF3885 domain-containing protein n=1 Tax=Staphylococcus felis TaxID=46127 RepID=UPI000D0B018D|nr:hypothetical protein [Staphylococcus felis]AVP37559.1 hypothetical protein C7J90_11675 [Staphylococcus felis]QQB02492.1 hypothetical protein I6H71_06815 [Staphylococcus felis]